MTDIVPLWATAEVQRAALLATHEADRFPGHCDNARQLLEQYRLALLDIYVLVSKYGSPNQTGSPLEQVYWIALHRGLGVPVPIPIPETLDDRRHLPDYPRNLAEANDFLANWPLDYWTEAQLIKAQQIGRTPPALEG